MSKEEFMKIQTCVLKVNIHCDGCKHKVKKILQKMDGVFTTAINAEQGKVTVSGTVDAKDLIKRLQKKGKHAELWAGQKANNNQGNLANQFKNMQLDNGKGGNNNNNNNKGQKGGNNNQPKGGGGGGQPNLQQLQQQQLQQQQLQQQQLQQQLMQLQQMKGLQDLKLPPGAFKDMKMPPMKDQNQKHVKFSPEDDEFSDDYDDEFDDDEFDEDDYDDELDEPNHPLHKKPIMGNVPQGMPQNFMMMNGNHPQFMNAQKAAQIQNAAQNAKKGGNGGGAVPVQVNMGNNEGKNGNGGKKGGGNNGGNNQNQGGKNGKNGGGNPHDGKNGGGGGGGANNKNGNNGGGANGNNMNANGGKKGNNGGGGGMGAMNDGFQHMDGPHGIPNVKIGQMSSLPMGHQMGNMSMGNIPAVQGLPAAAVGGGAATAGGAGYFQGAGPDLMPGNPYHQQQQQQHQYMAAVMNQQRALGNERFQPMMYARPPPAVNYAPQHPYPYGYPPHPHPYGPQDPSYSFFSDENTSSCNVM